MRSSFAVRVRLNSLPQVNLPFYPRSCGVATADKIINGRKQILTAVELNWVLKGRISVQTTQSQYTLQEGEAVFYYPGDCRRRTIEAGKECAIYWVAIDGDGAELFVRSFAYDRQILQPGNCPVHLFNEVRWLLQSTLKTDLLRMVAVISEIICCCGLTNPVLNKRLHLLEKALRLIQTQFAEPSLNINQLAQLLKVHRSSLNRVFYEELQQTPLQYLNQYRICRGMSLLCETDLSMKEIALRVGFSQASYFNRLFRRQFGCTPSQFREHGLI